MPYQAGGLPTSTVTTDTFSLPPLTGISLQDELKELKQKLGAKIDYGNRLLSLDLVPRDENGVPVTPKSAGVMQLYKLVRGRGRGLECRGERASVGSE